MTTQLDKIIVVGDRVLIKPNDSADRTKSGLYLPAGYQDKEKIQSGYILKCGPGYPLPSLDEGESWNHSSQDMHYMPLQVQPGDLALFLQKNAIEIKYNNDKYFIVPQNAILLVERDEF
ncbi:MAG: co-chaperone GroES [Bacteroidales bacterium]|nr:co-chaperone GroES [Bacteroidales bacterium]